MLLSEIPIPVSRLSGAGEKTCASLAKLHITDIGDLLSFWPRSWEDHSIEYALSHFQKKYKIGVSLEVIGFDWFGFGTMKTLKIIARDKSGQTAALVCFNRSFLKDQFPAGSRIFVYGHFEVKYGQLQSSNFEIEVAEKAERKILPLYRLTEGISQKKLRTLIAQALKNYAHGISNALPTHVRAAHRIPEKTKVLYGMHQPKTLDEAAAATHAVIFEEFYLYQYALGLRSIQKRGRLPNEAASSTLFVSSPDGEQTNQAHKEITEHFSSSLCKLQTLLLERLPFQLTADQMSSIYESNLDLKNGNTISTLIQGDVGSGKTIVAFFISTAIIEAGGQVAFLAPTELLAKQHAENAAKFLEPLGVRIAFLTGNIKARGRTQLLTALKNGELDLVVGTHALFSNDVRYKNLQLAIIDEQHRFGVLQRQAIIQKGIESSSDKKAPHVIMMSATPIPRSLTLSIFGDMDVSLIKTKPVGRKPVITYVSKKTNRHKVYGFVKNEIEAGHQAYVVAPLIDDESESELRSATEIFNQLKALFPHFKLALLHSKVATESQEKIMLDFKNGSIDILIATSIIEVGVDVPNATCIVIEQAERFGLAALHQLRGRVGRGSEQAYCFLLYGKNSSRELTEQGIERLRILRDSTDGFEIAEKDLELRGPGDILGVAQSGYDLGFKLADPQRDFKILQEAMEAAFDVIRNGE